MAETQRTISDLQTLLADNTSGDISPQDSRDVMETLRAGHAEIYIATPAATTFTDSTSYEVVAGTWALSSGAYNWAMDVNGQLKYTGVANRMVHVAASFSIESSAANMIPYIAIAKNGTVLTPSIISRKMGSTGDVGSSALHAFTSVSNGDYLQLMIRNSTWTAAQTITADTANMFVMDMAAAS
jgi:hypothetical protein